MTPRKRSAGQVKPAGSEKRHDDPRFVRMCATLAADPRYEKAVLDYRATQASRAPRRFGSNALRVGPKIFAMMAHGTLVVKLPNARVDELVKAGSGERFDPGHGRIMKEWFVATSGALDWARLARDAHDYVAASRERPTAETRPTIRRRS